METFRAEDYHTAGEPFRILADLGVEIPGASVADRRVCAMNSGDIDRVRQILCFEPRGHADMYGGFITPPDDADAHFGVLFWHKDGFSTACGHGTIALGVWAVETGRVGAPETGLTDVVIDVPSGRVAARVHTEAGQVVSVDFVNVASYVLATGVKVSTFFADGELDRSPCGSGTCARVATLAHTGQLADGQELVHGSVVGSTFRARVRAHAVADGRDAVLPEVSGMAYKTGTCTFSVDPRDPLVPGFVLR